MHLKFKLIICLFLLTGATLVLAEQSKFQVGPVYTDPPGEVSVVVDLKPGLTPDASNFNLIVDQEPLAVAKEIKSFREAGRNLALAICVDISGTMKKKKKGGADPLADTQKALLSFLGKVRAEDRIALISFADQDTIKSPFDDSRENLSEAVRQLHSEGKETRLYQTLYDVFDVFQGVTTKLRRVLVISDGYDEDSIENLNAVTARAKNAGVSIDAVGYGRIDGKFTDILNGLSKLTGGRFVHARHLGELTDAFDWLYSSLIEKPLVVYFTYETGEEGDTTQNAEIELRLPGQNPERVRISQEIPVPKIQSNLWLYLVFLFLGLSIGVFIWIRNIFKEDGNKIEVKDSVAENHIEQPTGGPIIDDSPSIEPAEADPDPIVTKVGGYSPGVSESELPAIRLAVISGPAEGRMVDVEKDNFKIGAGPDNDLDLIVDDYVSSQHASIHYEGGTFRIFDQGSRNGTLVNQKEVTSSGVSLNVDDRITIGRSTLEVVDPSK